MAAERDASYTLTSFDEGRSLRVPHLRVAVTLPDGRVVSEPLGLGPLVIGQSAECDLVVPDPKVSRRHCDIRLTDEGLLLQDLGSRNGTFIRDVRVVEAFVPPAVPIVIGDSTILIQPGSGVAVLPLSEGTSFGPAVGQSLAMRALFAKLERAAPTDETVLLLGESGTGKEVLARAIHENSRRKSGPFMVVDCGALASSILESELFGAVAGAATGVGARAGMIEMANRGTLFIDEIGELPLELQQKLLRVIEDRKIRRLGSDRWQPIDVRIVAATHRNLRARAAEGTFRQDLYYRLAVLEMAVPPLRERKEDIPMFVEWFLAKRSPPGELSDLPPETIPMLMGYDWPGNVRELRNVVARLVLFPELLHEMMGGAAGGQAGGLAGGLPGGGERGRAAGSAGGGGAAGSAKGAQGEGAGAGAGVGAGTPDDERIGRLIELTYPEAREAVLSELERKYAAAKLRQFDGNISRTAEAMGVSRPLLQRLLDRHGMRAKK